LLEGHQEIVEITTLQIVYLNQKQNKFSTVSDYCLNVVSNP